MKLSFHPGVQTDVNAILAYYDEQGGERLADRFYQDLTARFQDILEHPQKFPYYLGNKDQKTRKAASVSLSDLIPHFARPDSGDGGEA